MNNFWNDVKQTFSGPKPELDETGKAILDIENKKRTITGASENEQAAIREKISAEYRRIGETAYTLHEAGEFGVEKIAPMFQTVKGLYQTLEEKKAKLNEILGRYDEELKILRPVAAGQAACPSCGNSYIPGEMLFCNKCGAKLPEKAPDTGEGDSGASEQSKCPGCNAALVPGAAFCAACGYKI